MGYVPVDDNTINNKSNEESKIKIIDFMKMDEEIIN